MTARVFSRRRHLSFAALVTASATMACASGPPPDDDGASVPSSEAVSPAGHTAVVPNDPDDPAVWLNAANPAASLIIATDKMEGDGGLYVFGLDGHLRQRIGPLDRPNNVDVEYGVRLGDAVQDIAVVTERRRRQLRVFAISADGGPLRDLAPAGVPVLAGVDGSGGEPMGVALYKRPTDGAVFVIVAPKAGGATDYLWQYRLEARAAAAPTAHLVRRFGAFSERGAAPGETGEIEAVVVDDELGVVYYSDERYGIREYHADPDHPSAAQPLSTFGLDGYVGDREGLAIYATGSGTGYIVSSDQIPGQTRLHIYRREGSAGSPHDHPRLGVVPTQSDDTDGLDAASASMPGLPSGLLVMMNSTARNFLLYDWSRIEARLRR